MSALPWFKFFPSSWRSDPALRSCCLAARGLWMELLALMHEGQPRGHLRLSIGEPIARSSLAALTGVSPLELETLLAELQAAGVFSVDEDGVIFSRRMVRDEEKARRDSEHGRRGGNPQITRRDKAGVKGRVKPAVKSGLKLTKLYPLQEMETSQDKTPSEDDPFGAVA